MRQILPRERGGGKFWFRRRCLLVFRVIRGSFCFRSDGTIHESHETHEATVETQKKLGCAEKK